jgi:hypothetical protein
MMRGRAAYVLGDLLTNGAGGALAGLTCAGLVETSWPGPVAMLAGMALGMIVVLPLQLLASLFLGAFEVMLPLMLTGMAAGMAVAMAAAMQPLTALAGIQWGALIGLACLAFTYLVDAALRGEARSWTS